MSDILITPNRGSTNAPTIQFSGSVNASASIRLEVLPEGQIAFLGKSGSLFSISDSMSGSLMAVSDISGLPILEVFSDDRIVMGKFNKPGLTVTGSQVLVAASASVTYATASLVVADNYGSGRGHGIFLDKTEAIIILDSKAYSSANGMTTTLFNNNVAVGLKVSKGSTYGSGTNYPIYYTIGATATSDLVEFQAGNSTAMAINGSQNVGIGKTAPINAKLDIVGNTIITGSLTSSLDANIATMTVGRGKGSIATNTAIGYQPLYNNTTGDFNTAIGYQALLNNTYGFQNTALGASALAINVSGSYNIAISQAALNNNKSGSFNIAIGGSALSSNVGADSNIAVGYQSLLFNNTGDSNIGIGKSALLTNVSGRASVAVGSSALTNSTGDKCIGVGHSAGSSITSGVNNIVIGNSTTGITTGANNVVIGNSVTGLSTSLANTVIIADGAGNIRQYIDSSGNMSLGKTSSINAKLDVNGNTIITGSLTTTAGIYSSDIVVASSGITAGFWLAPTPNGTPVGYLWHANNTISLIGLAGKSVSFSTNSTEKARIDTSGNMGIGTTAPNAKLDVNGNTIITGSLIVTSGITGSLLGTASYIAWASVDERNTDNFLGTSSYATTASYALNSAGSAAAALDFSPIFMMMGA